MYLDVGQNSIFFSMEVHETRDTGGNGLPIKETRSLSQRLQAARCAQLSAIPIIRM